MMTRKKRYGYRICGIAIVKETEREEEDKTTAKRGRNPKGTGTCRRREQVHGERGEGKRGRVHTPADGLLELAFVSNHRSERTRSRQGGHGRQRY